MGRLIINVAMTVNGAFEAPAPEPMGGWLVTDADSMEAGREMWQAADAMLLGRKTYEGLAAAWPQLANAPGFEAYAARMNSMPKFVASRTLTAPLEWNATLLDGDMVDAIRHLKHEHPGTLIAPSAGEFARELIAHDLVDEYWITVSPYLWANGPRLFDGIGPIRLEPTGTTIYPSGLVRLSYRPVPQVEA
ncbi:dihydrofolate reductase [Brevibacterium sanguinis]|uniref:Dihydrofolate reductase n=2 Tax=Brevibacterium TaxID=1696 RepID=A0A366IK86_9MICO|nr:MULTISPECIES: dihydrofolate reductase family protein [Brevibacterium]RBP66192.1 dihydrofolate reductase [Brevibacterium sanguinis]RBP72843.1 dihydrofolate reductase [Brevibacterium celere]